MKYVLLILFSLSLSSLFSQSKPVKKIALVIGVANYNNPQNRLKNPVNDANALTIKLKKLGFDVQELLDPTLRNMSDAVDSFGKKMLSADVCLFFYSGHGAELDGNNYLFPIDSKPIVPSDLEFEAFPLNKLLGKIQYADAPTNIILLDACRSNPFTKDWQKGENKYEGLANVSYSPNGTFIGFAASPGKTASDGSGNNAPYTNAILEYIETPNISIDQLFNKVNKEVRTETNGQQIPYKSSSLEDDFFFLEETQLSNDDDLPKTQFPLAPLNRPKFPRPKEMKGEMLEKLNSYAVISINKSIFKQDDFIELYLSLISKNIWDEASPVYVSIDKKSSAEANGGIVVFSDEFQPSDINNRIRIAAPDEPGIYELDIGFYFLNEFKGEYPPFHSRRFTFTVQ